MPGGVLVDTLPQLVEVTAVLYGELDRGPAGGRPDRGGLGVVIERVGDVLRRAGHEQHPQLPRAHHGRLRLARNQSDRHDGVRPGDQMFDIVMQQLPR
jgi:hypothetical protein